MSQPYKAPPYFFRDLIRLNQSDDLLAQTLLCLQLCFSLALSLPLQILISLSPTHYLDLHLRLALGLIFEVDTLLLLEVVLTFLAHADLEGGLMILVLDPL